MQFKKKLIAERRKIKPSPQSNSPQYAQMQGYKSQGEIAVRRTYREIMGTLK
jgi:hypothetical protein